VNFDENICRDVTCDWQLMKFSSWPGHRVQRWPVQQTMLDVNCT